MLRSVETCVEFREKVGTWRDQELHSLKSLGLSGTHRTGGCSILRSKCCSELAQLHGPSPWAESKSRESF